MRYWVAIATPDNWRVAFEQGNTVGLTPRFARRWEQVQPGDFLVLYATDPVRGVIGYGTIRQKLRQDKPLWPEEEERGEVIWPLRLVFDPVFVFPPDRWQEERVVNEVVNFKAKLGFRELEEDIASAVIAPLKAYLEPPEGEVSQHDRIVVELLEIGRLQNNICEKEYPMENTRLDAVWRRVERSVPNYVFEVQIGGNIYQALAKLKHAYDLWNSNIYLVARKTDKDKVTLLLSGAFHEIRERLRFIDERVIKELATRKREVRELEARLGLAKPPS